MKVKQTTCTARGPVPFIMSASQLFRLRKLSPVHLVQVAFLSKCEFKSCLSREKIPCRWYLLTKLLLSPYRLPCRIGQFTSTTYTHKNTKNIFIYALSLGDWVSNSPLAFVSFVCGFLLFCFRWLLRNATNATLRPVNLTSPRSTGTIYLSIDLPSRSGCDRYECGTQQTSAIGRVGSMTRRDDNPEQPAYTPADRCSTYRKYVPAAYARKLNKPNTPAAMFDPRPRPYRFDQEASCTMKAMK